MVELAVTVAVELNSWIGVGGCGWSRLTIFVPVTVIYRALKKSATTSDSEAEAITLHRITEAVRIGPLGMGATVRGFKSCGGQSLR